MTLLVVGASGHLGGEVCRRALVGGGRWSGRTTGRPAPSRAWTGAGWTSGIPTRYARWSTGVELAGLVARHYRLDPGGLRISSTVEAGLPVPAEVRLDSTRAGALLKTRLRGVHELFPAA